jgi:hypothetical protein
MMKASLLVLVGLTVLIAVGLRWREERVATLHPPARRIGFIAAQKRKLNRWITAAALAAIGTTVLMGGLHWLRVWQQ